jgi:ABC-2 type transport system permease protein
MTTQAVRQQPSVLGDDTRRLFALTWTLATTDFKLRFYGSALGYAWTLVRPFALFGVLYVVFAELLDLGKDVKNFPAYILLSMTFFQFFRAMVDSGLTCLVTRENLLRKMRFPRLVIPLAVTLGAIFELAMTLVAVAIFLLLSGIWPSWGWLELIPIAVLLTMLGTGLGLLFSVLYVRFRDMSPIWDVIAQMLFYATPVIYVAQMVPGNILSWYLCNPVAAALTELRHAVIDPGAPSAAALIGGWERLLIPLALVFGLFFLGAWAFAREAPKVAENL